MTLKNATLPFIDEHSYDEAENEAYAFLPGRHVLCVARPKGESFLPVAVLLPITLLLPVAVAAGALVGAGAAATSSNLAASQQRKGVALVCPTFKAGHRYVVLSRVNKAKTAWHPLVWDVTAREWVEIACAPNQTEEVDDDELAW